MSQADNLAALGSNVNTSGVLQPAGGGTGTTTATGTGSVVLSSGATLTNATINGAVASGFTMKNRIINGDMVIDQRNNGASVTASIVGTYTYTIDRFGYQASQASRFNIQQNAGSVTRPAGFTNYLGITSSSAYTVGASDYFFVGQPIEGFNTSDLAWGTANARTVTLSFWVRSSLTGTFGGSLSNFDASRSYPFSYTISSANTWEQKTITIAGDTTGTWLTTTGRGINVFFGLGVGSTFSGTANAWAAANFIAPTGATSVVGTNGATWYITGVQLEQGSSATSFEWLPYSTELALCQRYFETSYDIVGLTWFDQAWFSGNVNNGATYYASVTFKVSKRTNSPTVTTFRLGESNFSTAAPTVGNATNVGFSANKAATNTNAGNFVFSYYVSNEL